MLPGWYPCSGFLPPAARAGAWFWCRRPPPPRGGLPGPRTPALAARACPPWSPTYGTGAATPPRWTSRSTATGPVTEIQRRVGIAVHQPPTAGAVPHPLAEPEIGPVTAAAVMGLGGSKPPIGDHKPATLPRALVGQEPPNLPDAGLRDAAAKPPTAHPAGHRGHVEILDHDGAVAAGELGGQGVEMVSAEVCRSPVKRRQLGVRLAVGSGADDPAGALPGHPATLLVHCSPWGGMRNGLDGAVAVGDDRPLPPNPQVDPTAGLRLRRDSGRLADDRLHRHHQPAPVPALLGQGHRQDPRPALDDQPLQPTGVLLAAQPPNHRQDEVATVGLQAHRPSGKAHPATVAMAGLEPGEPDPSPRPTTVLGVRPVVQPLHQVGDAGRVGLLRACPPPGRDLVLSLVPLLAELVGVPCKRGDATIDLAGIEVAFDLRQRPIMGEPPATELLGDPRPLLRVGWFYLETEATRDPASRNHKAATSGHSVLCVLLERWAWIGLIEH